MAIDSCVQYAPTMASTFLPISAGDRSKPTLTRVTSSAAPPSCWSMARKSDSSNGIPVTPTLRPTRSRGLSMPDSSRTMMELRGCCTIAAMDCTGTPSPRASSTSAW